MNNPFSFFDEIYCISAKSRPRKKLLAARQFEDLGILDRVEFLDAIMTDPYWVGCRESHRACIRKAKSNGAENVLIFEEDVFFIHKDLEALRGVTITLQNLDWQVFSLGGVVTKVLHHVDDNLCLVKGHLNHAHAMHKSCWDEVLDYKPTDECLDAGKTGVFNKARLDLFLAKKYDKYMIKPMMAVQPDRASQILTSYYDKILK